MSYTFNKTKEFVEDVFITFFRFIFELALIVSYLIVEVYYMVRNVIREVVIPNIIHFFHDVNHVLYIAFGGFCWFLSTFCLKTSKFLLQCSDKLMRKSEEITHKTWSI